MDFALFGEAFRLLGQHSHLPAYSPEYLRQCQKGPSARKQSGKDPGLLRRFEIPWEIGWGWGEQGTARSLADMPHFVLVSISWAQRQHQHCLQESPWTNQDSRRHHLRLLPKKSLPPLRKPKTRLKLTICDVHFSPKERNGTKMPLPIPISFPVLMAFSCWDLI